MNTYAPSGCSFGREGVGEGLASLRLNRRLRALPEGFPYTLRALTETQQAWLGTWVPRGEVQHLQDSYGFRCGMDLDEGIKLFDVRRGERVEKVSARTSFLDSESSTAKR